MITLSRDADRRHVQLGGHNIWLTFYPRELAGSTPMDLHALAGIDELQLAPDGIPAPRPSEGAEFVTYVYKGALSQEDSTGAMGVVYAGEFQRTATDHGIHLEETNASPTIRTHLYRISLHPPEVGKESRAEGARDQKRFAKAQRHNVLCVVASPDGRKGSLRLVQDALIYSSVLDPGHHLIHELLPGRNAWLHVVHGEATLQDIVLTRGDGAGVTLEPSVSLTAQQDTELLLVDLGPPPGYASSTASPRVRAADERSVPPGEQT